MTDLEKTIDDMKLLNALCNGTVLDDAISFLTELKALSNRKQQRYMNDRYSPGYWNGLNGGMFYGQYFDMEDINRIIEMTEVISALKEYGVSYSISKFKRKYRVTITGKDYRRMDENLKRRIFTINTHYNGEWM